MYARKDELFQYLNHTNEIEKCLLNLIDNNDISEEQDLFDALFKSFDQIYNESKYNSILSFLRLLDHISRFHPTSKSLYHQMFKIFDHLLSSYHLLDFISLKDLLSHIVENRMMLLLLYEFKILNIEQLVHHLKSYDAYGKKFHVYFFPELEEFSSRNNDKYIKRIVKKMKLQKEYDFFIKDRDHFKECRIMGHHDGSVLEAIRNDNINQFQYIIERTEMDINSKIGETCFEQNYFIQPRMSLLDYSLIFGSINVFKYILNKTLPETNLSQDSIDYAIVGGNYDILHILEQYENLTYVNYNVQTAISCHREDITNYIIDLLEEPIEAAEELNEIACSHNYCHLLSLFLREGEFFDQICFDGDILKYFISTQDLFLINFALQQKNINSNIKNNIFSYF